jgi:hypothetical protein
MVWVVEKKVVHHMLSLGFERVDIPVRVKFEFEVEDGSFVPKSLTRHTVYNRNALERRYPALDVDLLEDAIENTVKREILQHLRECGFLEGEGDPDVCL